jgi:hypothetical protein
MKGSLIVCAALATMPALADAPPLFPVGSMHPVAIQVMDFAGQPHEPFNSVAWDQVPGSPDLFVGRIQDSPNGKAQNLTFARLDWKAYTLTVVTGGSEFANAPVTHGKIGAAHVDYVTLFPDFDTTRVYLPPAGPIDQGWGKQPRIVHLFDPSVALVTDASGNKTLMGVAQAQIANMFAHGNKQNPRAVNATADALVAFPFTTDAGADLTQAYIVVSGTVEPSPTWNPKVSAGSGVPKLVADPDGPGAYLYWDSHVFDAGSRCGAADCPTGFHSIGVRGAHVLPFDTSTGHLPYALDGISAASVAVCTPDPTDPLADATCDAHSIWAAPDGSLVAKLSLGGNLSYTKDAPICTAPNEDSKGRVFYACYHPEFAQAPAGHWLDANVFNQHRMTSHMPPGDQSMYGHIVEGPNGGLHYLGEFKSAPASMWDVLPPADFILPQFGGAPPAASIMDQSFKASLFIGQVDYSTWEFGQ